MGKSRILSLVTAAALMAAWAPRPAAAASAEQPYAEYTVTQSAEGLSLTGADFDASGYVTLSAKLATEKRTGGYDPVTLVAKDPKGQVCAILEASAEPDSGRAEFRFALDRGQKLGGSYPLILKSPTGGEVQAELRLYNNVGDALAEIEELLTRVGQKIRQCRDRGLAADYEEADLAVAERTAELLREPPDRDFFEYNLPVCLELLREAEARLDSYLSGEAAPLSVPKLKPDSVEVRGKSLVGTVVQDGLETRRPVFLNGYIPGWEDRDDTDFFNRIGVNSLPYTLAINRVIGQPGTAYRWTASGRLTQAGGFRSGQGGLEIMGSQGYTGMMYQMVSLKAGEAYTLRFKAKGRPGNNVKIALGASGQTDYTKMIEPSEAWETYSEVYTPQDTCPVEFRISVTGDTPGTWLEDLSFTDSQGRELLTNGGFDEWFGPGETFGVNDAALEFGRRELLDYKEKGYAVILTGGFSNLPAFVTAMEGVKDAGAQYGNYIPYNPTHPMVLGAIRAYLAAALPVARDCGNVTAFLIHNEPSFNAYGKAYYQPEWERWIKDRYGGDIAGLNLAYQTSYTDFSQVPMQNTGSLSDGQKLTRAYYDWRQFNDGILTRYHNAVAEAVHELDPGLPVGTKIMQKTSTTAALVQVYGTDYEAFGPQMDINMNDGWARADSASVAQPLQAQLMWYDYQMGIHPAPVLNAENHFALDKEELNYDPDFAGWIRAMLWQGAVHGLSGSHTWLWGRSDQTYPAFINTTVQYRADVAAEIGKTGMDLNRLSREVAAFREAPARAAILFSETAKSYNRQFENAAYQAYAGALYTGVKTDIVTESAAERFADYDYLILPETTHLPESCLTALEDFVKAKGPGHILMLAQDCLSYDETGNLRADTGRVQAIRDASEVINSDTPRNLTGGRLATVSNIEEKVKQFYQEAGLIQAELTDTQGRPVSRVEMNLARGDNGAVYLNLCSYQSEPLEVQVKYLQKTLDEMEDLLNNKRWKNTITLEPNRPALLLLEAGEQATEEPVFGILDFGDSPFAPDGTGGEIVREGIPYLAQGDVFAKASIPAGASLVLALKSGGVLKRVSWVQGPDQGGAVMAALRIEALKPGDYLTCFVWNGALTPVRDSVLLRQNN